MSFAIISAYKHTKNQYILSLKCLSMTSYKKYRAYSYLLHTLVDKSLLEQHNFLSRIFQKEKSIHLLHLQ